MSKYYVIQINCVDEDNYQKTSFQQIVNCTCLRCAWSKAEKHNLICELGNEHRNVCGDFAMSKDFLKDILLHIPLRPSHLTED